MWEVLWSTSHWHVEWCTVSVLDLLHSFTVGLWHGDINEWFSLDEEVADFLVVLLAEDGLDVFLGGHSDEGVVGLVLHGRVW